MVLSGFHMKAHPVIAVFSVDYAAAAQGSSVRQKHGTGLLDLSGVQLVQQPCHLFCSNGLLQVVPGIDCIGFCSEFVGGGAECNLDRLVSLPDLLCHSDAVTPFHIDIQYDQIIGSGSPCMEKCFAAWIGVDPVDGVKHLGQLRLK